MPHSSWLKKCRKSEDVLFINASEGYKKDKRQNRLEDKDIEKIVDTYQFRKEEPRYSKRISLEQIEKEDFNLNITRYVSTAQEEEPIDLQKVNDELKDIARKSKEALTLHNEFLKELGLPPIAD